MTNRHLIQSGLIAVLAAVAASGWAGRASGQQSRQLVPLVDWVGNTRIRVLEAR